jgi:3-dehydroquinate dehydratase-2
MKMKIFVINGPNLDFLGIREPEVYGTETLSDIEKSIQTYTQVTGHEVSFFQSNSESTLIEFIHQAYHENVDGLIINPAAFTHYSYALHDAIKAVGIPTVEVHLSNIHSREPFRQKSVIAPACVGQIAGFKKIGYILAVQALESYIKEEKR